MMELDSSIKLITAEEAQRRTEENIKNLPSTQLRICMEEIDRVSNDPLNPKCYCKIEKDKTGKLLLPEVIEKLRELRFKVEVYVDSISIYWGKGH